MGMRRVLVLLCIGALAFVGCPREDSCLIRTEGIYFAFRVVEEDGQATVSAVFTVGGALGTELALGDCGDDITVNGTALQEHRNVFVYYEAVMAAADSYEFVFTRDGEGPYVSTVTPPPPVNITGPEEAAVISRQDAFDITWEDNYEASPGISLFLGGPCIGEILRNVGDNGLYTINADELQFVGVDDTCDVDIVLTRLVQGDLDPAIEGFINAKTVDRTWISSTP